MGLRATPTREQWRRTLRPVVAAERRQGIGSLRPRRLVAGGPFAVRGDLEPLRPLFHGLGGRDRAYFVDDQVTIWSRTRARLVRIGKFDVDAITRLRAFYPQRGLALRLQGARVGEDSGVDRELTARRTVAEHAPHLAPQLLSHGAFDVAGEPVAYLFEELIEARQLRSRKEIGERIGEVAELLTDLHTSVGVASEPMERVVRRDLPKLWTEAVAEHGLDPSVDAAVQALFARNERLEVSISHGDLVGSNILVASDDRLVLVDWEFSRTQPIAFDLAKPLLQAADHEAALAELRRAVAPTMPASSGSFTLEEQLTVAVARALSVSVRKRAKAEKAGRLDAWAEDARRRRELLGVLLGR
jgi:hypothetical protein